MIKSELVERIVGHNLHLSERDVERLVNAVFEKIIAGLADGGRVELRGFGTFSVKQRLARNGRNPRTGVTVSVGKKIVPHFKTGKEMRLRLNRREA